MVTTSVLESKIRIRQLRCFVYVARNKSFVIAAKEMGLTQPAISRSVRELELIIGYPLFDRSQRGAELTARGRALLDAAETGLLQISHGVALATGSLRDSQMVRIGALPNVCSQYLPNIVARFKKVAPDVDLRITPGANADLLDSLRRGDADVVIGRLSTSTDMRGLVFEALFDEPLIFVVGENHRLAHTNASLEAALSCPLVLPPIGTVIRVEIDRYLAGKSVTQLNNIIETTSSDFQRAYIMQNECVCIVPRGVVQDDLARGTMVQLPIANDEMTGPVGLTTNPDIAVSSSLAKFLDLVRSQL